MATSAMDQDGAPPLRLHTKILYGFGSVAYGVKDVAFRAYLLLYYNLVVGLDAALVSTAILIALVIDAVIDPAVGHFSDNLRTRWGRRHPLIFAAAIPIAISFILLWTPPAGLSDTGTFIYLVVVASLVRVFITFYELPSSALAPELSEKYDERTSIASFRYFFGYGGGVVISFAMLFLFLRPTPEHPVGQLNPDGYWTFALVGAAVMFISILVSAIGTLPRVKYMRQLPKPARVGALGAVKQMKESFSHRGFLSILAFGVLGYTAIGMGAALTLYFATFFWELDTTQMAILTLDGIIAATLSLIVAPICSRTIGKRNAAFLLAVVAVSVAVTPLALRLVGLFPENGDPLLVPVLFGFQIVYGVCGISSAILVHAMIGDVVDESAVRTGRRSEGLFYAANSFMQQCVSGLGVFLAGVLISSVGLEPGSRPGQVDPEIIRNLALIYMPTLAALYIVGASFLYFYRIDRTTHEATLVRLKAQEAGLTPPAQNAASAPPRGEAGPAGAAAPNET